LTTIRQIAAIGAALTIAGCADKILSDDRIRDDTALALNVPTTSLVIRDRRYDGFGVTYYTARTPRVAYRCRIGGGHIGTFGITDPPECSRQ